MTEYKTIFDAGWRAIELSGGVTLFPYSTRSNYIPSVLSAVCNIEKFFQGNREYIIGKIELAYNGVNVNLPGGEKLISE